MEARLLPIGIQDFEDLRNRGCIYVDKTAYVYKLAKEGKPYFLSRPRRFGKSLLLSTLEYYFLGKKDLFKGLAIEKLEKDWIEYPVLKISFGGGSYETKDKLLSIIDFILSKYEKDCGIDKFYAFLDINPVAKGHTLVIPKQEIDYLFDEPDELLAAHMLFTKRVAAAVRKAIPCTKVGITVMGLEVPHAHIHVIPMQQEGDMDFKKPHLQLSADEMKEICDKIASSFV